MNYIFATGRIVDFLPESIKGIGSPGYFAYNKLIEAVEKSRVALKIPEESVESLLEVEDKLGSKDELEVAPYQLLLDWFSSSKISIVKNGEKKLEISGIRKGKLRELDPIYDEQISSAIYDLELNDEKEKKIIKELSKLLMHNQKFSDEEFSFLFEVKELDKIEPNKEVDWKLCIRDYVIPTIKVRILDKYFLKNNYDKNIRNVLGGLVTNCPSDKIEVELIFDLQAFSDKWEDKSQRAIDWKEKQDSDRLEVKLFNIKKAHKTEFHDRYLWTKYWSLQVPAGIDQGKTTIPTLAGRYSPNSRTWEYISENWDEWTKNLCEQLEN